MIVKEIILGDGSVKEKLKRLLLYLSRKRGAKKVWDRRHKIVFDKHPEYKNSLDDEVRTEHQAIWKFFNKKFNDATLKICRSTSGTANPLTIPEEIFQTDIEPTLNRYSEAHFQAHKSLYNRWFENGLFPDDLLHLIDGELLDGEYNSINPFQIKEMCMKFKYPVVMKPNKESWGGRGINFLENSDAFLKHLKNKTDIVVQRKIRQHPELAKYHKPSLNTVRVYLYKSVADNQVHILNMVLRMGNGGPLDNVSAGGLVSLINEDGFLHGYALDMYGKKYIKHPVSGQPFTGSIPNIELLKKLSIQIVKKLFLLRVVGLDLCYDETGRWRAIEINTKGHSIRFIQYAGKSFFGEFTEEVIEYCRGQHWAKVH